MESYFLFTKHFTSSCCSFVDKDSVSYKEVVFFQSQATSRRRFIKPPVIGLLRAVLSTSSQLAFILFSTYDSLTLLILLKLFAPVSFRTQLL